ncbi:hypothetical protein B0H13DRAFT_1886105 [Mycena leptocephala]|nr:hypothetical protein B0H13DRAFT_1886105 [Mycena leptocephala]
MLSNKSFFATVSAAMFIGTASAFNGTAFLAATGFNSCGCAITSDTLAVGVSSTLVGSHVCCISTITAIAPNTPPQQLILQIADGGASNIADILVSPSAFAALGGSPGETSISSVVWMWN